MVCFSFLSASSPGCVVSSGSSTWWTDHCPAALVTAIREAHSKDEIIINVSVANDGDWFLRTDEFNRKKPGNDPMESRVLRFCQVATVQTGRKTELGNVQWITFTPDGQGFIGVVGHDGAAYCVFDKIPQTLDEHLKTRDEQSEVKMVSIGYDNSWVIVYQDGDISADEICTSLADKLRAVGSEVKSVILSPSAESNWVITYENGWSHYDVPFAWTSGIDKQISLCQENFALELQQLQEAARANMVAASRFASTAATMRSYHGGIF
ncbi:hypothetical protein K443DRAFT_674814 [Laccaria amethystina LaAM-08-1]|uniref:Uncharacterized protein n=1 Tax=Laccaria amethystina LaAM-08-1 TaxID=1095629 RepID=A0A0C9YC54_9AGAR|nr:hypothetical protein K443DRAFT_674814 [Laccaria amethystina LaAM-08-1]